ncbi:chromosome segregation protein SMC [Bacillus songklensis]|uniref:Chromosome partition protein Smc n=1 Tax=Bacillus songklensis TaxID=1069116 RepID=A0ABV8AY66_9BACI
MFLKRLDIVGFKSFAEKISVDFVQGVTAVVGPNGSGKSNITDAIRWVLGEQSAKSLRGAKMEDIIFAGSDTRKPLNMAEVTLTLENEDQFLPIDYHEVSVTRRVYRSGDSEFLINKQPCRLKDIIDLFMDSGLGKEAFSIISQGKVEEILSNKAEERRSIFEEAAGVLKYKTRKRKAEIKLIETQENLNRVMDILHEIEGQLEPLKIQASIARDYIEKKEELKKIDIAVTVYEIEELHQKWEQLKRLFEEHQSLESSLSNNIQERESKIEEFRSRIQVIDEDLHAVQQRLLLTSQELEKLEGRKEVLKERKKNAAQNKQQLEQLIGEYQQKSIELAELKEREYQLLKIYETEVVEMKQALQEKQSLFATYSENLEGKLEQLKSDYFELLNEQTSARNEKAFLEQQIIQNEERQQRLGASNQKFLQERQELTERKEKLASELTACTTELETFIHSFRQKQQQLETLRERYRKKESTLYQAYQYVQQTKSRKEMLEEMQEDYAGYFQGVKEVLKARDERLQGIEGAVAELIQVPKEYETAIEIALGAATQHIVVKDEQSARSAIQFLKRHSYGRATFLPLSTVREKQLSSSHLHLLQQHDSFVGVASQLISFSSKYQQVIGSLLGTVIIAKDLQGANELAKYVQHRYRFVTLEGDVVNPGGSMTGGTVRQKTNSLLGRQRELENMTAKLGEMEEKTIQLETQVKELKGQMEALEQDIQLSQSAGEELRTKHQDLKTEVRQIELEEKTLNDRLSLYDHEMESFDSDKQRIHIRLKELESTIEDSSMKLGAIEHEIEMVTKQKSEQQTSKETVQNELTELKVVLASKQEVLKNQREKFERLRFELEQTEKRLIEVQEDLSLLTSEMTNNDSGESQLESAAKKKLQEKNELADRLTNRREERVKLQEQVEILDNNSKELKRQHKQVVQALQDEEVKINRLEVELDNRLERLSAEYQLSFEGAKQTHKLEIGIEEARKRMKLVKLAIEELGTVNIGAIDEHDRISERYDFLSSQKDDLEEAKNTLYQIIEEMDEEMKKRFSQTFYSIKEQFDFVFKSLFGGGRADLVLTDPKDLLRTGVDIIAQPPGKKLQNLSLLSGGERSLTAIALLFSILKVRPVPFCVLDEVEAALDEANVQRFAKYLRNFSDETQFIVITHRKGTMEEADVLYGVTMQESGVSKLVSVRMEESKEYAQ